MKPPTVTTHINMSNIASAELIAAGVTTIPKGMRKDQTLGRYTCEDHPACKRLVPARNFTGTRHKDANDVARFKDCLEVYIGVLQDNQNYEDDLTYAMSLMSMLGDVKVFKGPANMATNEIFVAALNAIKRTKGESVTMYDARFVEELKEINWDTGDGAPRVKIPSTLVSKYPDFERGTLMTFIWTQLLKKDIPEGHVVGPFTCDTYDVREENIQLIQGKAAFRITPDEWVIPEDVDIGMQFLPRGITVNKVKVMINQAGQLRPGEFGADAKGRWAKTITGKSTVAILIDAAIKILIDTHGPNEFNERNDKYQKLMKTYRDV